MALSRFLGKVWLKVKRAVLTLCIPVAMVSACNGCHSGLPKRDANVATNIGESSKLVKGRILIDPEFSGPERKMIAKALKMWTDPLDQVMQMEISEDPGEEAQEMIVFQRMVMMQERVKAGAAPEPDEDSDEEDTFVDPHDSWDSFDPRTPFWSPAQGCNDRAMVIRVLSDNARIRFLEMKSKATFVGWTDNGCHRKAILLVADRIDDEEEFVGVAAHEFGHLFGLKHDFKRKESVMYPGAYFSHCVTRRDIESFCDRWQCKGSTKVKLPKRSCG